MNSPFRIFWWLCLVFKVIDFSSDVNLKDERSWWILHILQNDGSVLPQKAIK